MRHFVCLACLSVVAVALAGCDGFALTRFQVSPSLHPAPAGGQAAGIEEGNPQAVREILVKIAADFRLAKADDPQEPNSLASYRENVKYWPIELRAWTAGATAVVEVYRFLPGLSRPPREYALICDRVERDLRERFGDRVRHVPWREALSHPKPTKDAAVSR